MFGGEDPFRDIESFFRKMSQLGAGHFTTGGSSSFSRAISNGGTFESIARGSYSPATTITDSGSQFLIEMDVPGISREDLKVTATGQKVCVSGQRRPGIAANIGGGAGDYFGFGNAFTIPTQQSTNNKQQGNSASQPQQPFQQVFMDERPVGFFERCFTFPNKVEESNISAQFNNGVLSVAVGHGGSDDKSKEISIR